MLMAHHIVEQNQRWNGEADCGPGTSSVKSEIEQNLKI